MPLDASLSRRQKRDATAPNGDTGDLSSLALCKADRPNTPHGRSVYVSNMLPGTSKESLRSAINFLLDHGQVVGVEMRERSNCLPYAFVELSSLQAAYELVQYKKAALVIGDQELKVQFKKIGLACTTPTRNSLSGVNEEVDPQKRSPGSLMAPFTPTGQTVQEVCRLVAYKLAHDFGLPSPGPPPPTYSSGDADALALSSKTVPAGGPALPAAPLASGLTATSREVEASRTFPHPALPTQGGQQPETEAGCHWAGETKKLNSSAKAFEPQPIRTDLPSGTNMHTPHQVHTLQQTSHQLYARYPCASEPLGGGSVPYTQRSLELSSPKEIRQLSLQLHGAGAVNTSQRQQTRADGQVQRAQQLEEQHHRMQALQESACLRDTPQGLSVFEFRGHQLLSGVHSALYPESQTTCRGPTQPFGEHPMLSDPHSPTRTTGNAGECQKAAIGAAQREALHIDSLSARGVPSAQSGTFEGLTPFPGVMTSKLISATSMQESWTLPVPASADVGSTTWRSRPREGPTSNATASTSLSASLGCDSLPSPSTCNSHPTPQEKDAEERNGQTEPPISIQETQKQAARVDGHSRQDQGSQLCTTRDLKGEEHKAKREQPGRHHGETEGTTEGDGNETHDQQPLDPSQHVRQHENNNNVESRPPPSSTSLMKRNTGSYFEMDVSNLMMPPAGTDPFEAGMQDRVLTFSHSTGYRQWKLEGGGDSCSTPGGSSPRAFSRRAHQMGLPSLVRALKPDEAHNADATSNRPPFLTVADVATQPNPPPQKPALSSNTRALQEMHPPAAPQSSQPGQPGSAAVASVRLSATSLQSITGTSLCTSLGSSGSSCLAVGGPPMEALGDAFLPVAATEDSTSGTTLAEPGPASAVHPDDKMERPTPVRVDSNVGGGSSLFQGATEPPLPSGDSHEEPGDSMHCAYIQDKHQVTSIVSSTEGHLPSAGSLASSTARTAAFFSPWETPGPCTTMLSRGRLSSPQAAPTAPRRASSSDPRGGATSWQVAATRDSCALIRREPPCRPAATVVEGTERLPDLTTEDSQVSIHLMKEQAHADAHGHDSTRDTQSATSREAPGLRQKCSALAGTSTAEEKEHDAASLPSSSKVEVPELDVEDHDLSDPGEAGYESQPVLRSSAREPSAQRIGSQRKEKKPREGSSAPDPSVELLLAVCFTVPFNFMMTELLLLPPRVYISLGPQGHSFKSGSPSALWGRRWKTRGKTALLF